MGVAFALWTRAIISNLWYYGFEVMNVEYDALSKNIERLKAAGVRTFLVWVRWRLAFAMGRLT